MLFLKRLVTTAVLFLVFGLIFYVVALAIMAGIAGAQAAAAQHATGTDAYRLGQAAGQEVGRRYGTLLLLCAVGMSATLSSALAFGGAFSWCRRGEAPPPLPGRYG